MWYKKETWPPSSAELQNLMRRVSFAWVRTTLTQPSNLQSSCKGFHIAFINIEFNHRLMVNSREGYGFLNSEFEIFVNVALTRARWGRPSRRLHHPTKLAGRFKPRRRARSGSGVAGGASPAPLPPPT
ncbi:hypothetical protein CRG98_041272 [Punica granatum]|uniref:Uncharacterized protein n=1 Tax=Punica granatum TaxID=22663 RepID=A0A2I0I315_PUNGR|nr:hypothetical protein CRG98_041272 [Punica granatum]